MTDTWFSKDTVDLEEFPTFSNGDVLFITPVGQNFKVHASVVKGASSVLAKMIEEATLIKLTKAQKVQGKTIIYKIKMTPCDIDDRLVDFIPQVRIPLDSGIVIKDRDHHTI